MHSTPHTPKPKPTPTNTHTHLHAHPQIFTCPHLRYPSPNHNQNFHLRLKLKCHQVPLRRRRKGRIISFPTDLFLDWTQIGFNWITRLIFPVTDCCLFRLKFRWKILIQPSDCSVKKCFCGRCCKTVGGNSKNLDFLQSQLSSWLKSNWKWTN